MVLTAFLFVSTIDTNIPTSLDTQVLTSLLHGPVWDYRYKRIKRPTSLLIVWPYTCAKLDLAATGIMSQDTTTFQVDKYPNHLGGDRGPRRFQQFIQVKSTFQVPPNALAMFVFTSLDWSRGRDPTQLLKVPTNVTKLLYKYLVIYENGVTEWLCDEKYPTEQDPAGHVNNVLHFQVKECPVCIETRNTLNDMCCIQVCHDCAVKYIDTTLPDHTKCMICRLHMPLKTLRDIKPDYLDVLTQYQHRQAEVYTLSFRSLADFKSSLTMYCTMACPRCLTRFQHDGGCLSMTCSICHHNFEWQGGFVWTMGLLRDLLIVVVLILAGSSLFTRVSNAPSTAV